MLNFLKQKPKLDLIIIVSTSSFDTIVQYRNKAALNDNRRKLENKWISLYQQYWARYNEQEFKNFLAQHAKNVIYLYNDSTPEELRNKVLTTLQEQLNLGDNHEKIDKEHALKLWDEKFGKNVETIKDFAGVEIKRAAYGDVNSAYGWNIDHARPVSKGGKDTKDNLVFASIKNNSEKADKFPGFKINKQNYVVVRVKGKPRTLCAYEIKKSK
ncbi:HNH endonuclease signature motif containing protein [Mycoplasma seminis]|uniref:HNH endonuclease signature motif containing protein n=1 Tax=Mycoplasma seminis TaxID=512749 RepID=A0ABY9HAH9_9MOLU|nr:HNH endonuclease signature motif containing protein [Mycoplasma seminis]WLP85199.1 HNH endonuclease signature motif containing protein [Mycoplasma seminis]